MLTESLVLTFPQAHKSRWYSLPVAFAIHGGVVLALILLPILLPSSIDPQLVLLYVNPAPPPPPPLRVGSQLVARRPTDVVPKPKPDSDDHVGAKVSDDGNG